MEVMISNQNHTLRCDGVACALLRDNVQHHLEDAVPGERFPAIHTLADSRWAEAAQALKARVLASELQTAWACLRDLPIESLAISIRTRAALTSAPVPPAVRGTVLHRLVRWPIPFELEELVTLDDLLGGLVAELVRVARDARAGDLLVTGSALVVTSPATTAVTGGVDLPTNSSERLH